MHVGVSGGPDLCDALILQVIYGISQPCDLTRTRHVADEWHVHTRQNILFEHSKLFRLNPCSPVSVFALPELPSPIVCECSP